MRVYELAKELKVSNNKIKIACGALDAPVKSHMTEIDNDLVEKVKEYIATADPEDLQEPEKKEMTKPWMDKTWSVDMFKLPKKHAGFRARFVPKLKVNDKLSQGWVVADAKDWGKPASNLPGEESQFSSAVVIKEMVLMEIPEKTAKEREEYIDWKSNKRAKDARKMAETQAKGIERQLGGDSRFETSSTTTQGY